jgi:hypothetical protein
MRGAIPPLSQYAFMVWCSIKAQGQLYLHLYVVCMGETRNAYILVGKLNGRDHSDGLGVDGKIIL